MIGALIGDVTGSSRIENPEREESYPLFNDQSRFTINTVMNFAVGKALLNTTDYEENIIKDSIKKELLSLTKAIPNISYYSESYKKWVESEGKILSEDGVETIVRVSSIAWLINDDEQLLLNLAKWQAEVTTSNQDAINASQAITYAIYKCRYQSSKYDVMKILESKFNIDFSKTTDSMVKEIIESKKCNCSKIVALAYSCIINSNSFEEAIRKSITLMKCSYVIPTIVGSIARAYWNIPIELEVAAATRLTPGLVPIFDHYNTKIDHPNPFFAFNQSMINQIRKFQKEMNKQNYVNAMEAIRYTMNNFGRFLVPTAPQKDASGKVKYFFKSVQTNNNKKLLVVYTDPTQADKQKDQALLSHPIDQFMHIPTAQNQYDGIIINPWTDKFVLETKYILEIFKVNEKTRTPVN